MSDQDYIDWQESRASHQLEYEEWQTEQRAPTAPSFDVRLPDGRTLIFETVDDAVIAAHTILSEAEIAKRVPHCAMCNDARIIAVAGPDENGQYDTDDCPACSQASVCECELDWNCPLHQGGPTAIERINDAWASEQTEIDRQNGM